MHDPMSEVLSRLDNVKHYNGYYIASCPAREDRNPSMTIRQGDLGVLMHDFGGSSLEEIVGAIGLSVSDLFYDDPDAKREWLKAKPPRKNEKKVYAKPVVPEIATYQSGAVTWFGKRALTEETMKHFGVYGGKHYFQRPKAEWTAISIPYWRDGKIVNVKHRTATGKDWAMEVGAQPVWFNANRIGPHPKEVVIAEGEFDVMAIWQATGIEAVSPPNGSQSISDEVVEDGKQWLADETVKIILAGDMDEAGRKMTEDIARRVGRERCARVTWPDGCKDANEVLMKIGPQAVKEAIEDAEPFPTEGIVRVRDVMEDVFALYRDGLPRGISTGIPSLDEHYTIKPGYWCAMTGSPGSGKSNVLDQIMCNMAERDGARFGIASLENRFIARHIANILPKRLRKPFGAGKTERMTEDEVREGTFWMHDHFEFIQPELPSLEEILKRAKALVFSSGITGLVIDPWNRLVHPPQGMNSGDYIARCLGQISDFAFHHGVYVWLVAHPTKLVKDSKGQYPVPTQYDISGSAHFYNMEDFGTAMWRDRKEYFNPVEFHVQKSRHQEIASESCIKLGYDPITTRYYDLAATGEDDFENWKPKNIIDFAREREEAIYLEDERDMAEAAAEMALLDQVIEPRFMDEVMTDDFPIPTDA